MTTSTANGGTLSVPSVTSKTTFTRCFHSSSSSFLNARAHACSAEPDDVNPEKRRGLAKTACMAARDVTPSAATSDVLEKRTNASVVLREVNEGRRKRVETCL